MDNSKNSMNNDKSLCLYCDKAFSSINDQENHVERDHKAILNKGKGSLRKSERITKNSSSENSHFAACFYCNNKKIIRSDDLESLFQHLLSAHKDIYFGCKCKTRLLDKISLTNHRRNCKIGGGKIFKSSSASSSDAINEKRKTTKKSQSKSKVDVKCDNNSESESISTVSSTVAVAAKNNNSVKLPPTNAINKKSDRSNVKNSNSCKNANHLNDKRNKNKNISSSSSSSSSSCSSKTSEKYTIPLTRQKLKEPVSPQKNHQQQNLSSNSKKLQKNSKTSATLTTAVSSSSVSEKSSSSSNASPTKVQRTKTTKVINQNSQNNCESIETTQKNDVINTEFDEDFYKNISHNIRINLNFHIDGKADRLQLSKPAFDHISTTTTETSASAVNTNTAVVASDNVTVFNDKQNDLSKTNHAHEKEIHESTNFELSTPFPALLTVEQYGFGDMNSNKNKRHITKNSWKWKWDLIKKYKYVNEGGKIVKKVKQITTGLKDLSQLDMWTQLSMRSRYENLNSSQNGVAEFDDGLNDDDSLSSRIIKTQNIEQLNNILDKRLKPEINIEQLQQTLVKEELIETECSDTVTYENDRNVEEMPSEMLSMLNLTKTSTMKVTNFPALSGEWARPRCFVCVDCGQEFDLMKSLNDHKNSEHPYVVSAHYEVVGRENLEQKLYRNLFLPKKALQLNANATTKSISINSDSKSNDATSTSESSSNYQMDQKEKECTKCMKMIKYSNDIDIYRHILDCIEDRVWMQAKKRSKYRRSRRKNKKNIRKPRLSTDQKKSTSSPFQKENTEGENSTLSNPPTPSEEKKTVPITAITTMLPTKNAKKESFISDATATTKNDGMNIKSFFRISKTTPNLPQKFVVQMLEMPRNSHNSSLRHSLRSSAKKQPNINNSKHQNDINNKKSKETNISETNDAITTDNNSIENSNIKKEETISEEIKIETTDTNQISNAKDCISPTKELPALQIIDSSNSSSDKANSLLSPTNSSSALISPTSSSTVPAKKKKKLNDCIAMLTCKIQEKLGVNFFESTSTEIFPTENTPKHEAKEELLCKTLSPSSLIISPPSPCISPKIITPPALTTINTTNPNVPQIHQTTPLILPQQLQEKPDFICPEQNEVIDLSVKKKPEMKREKIKFPSLHDDIPTEKSTSKESEIENTKSNAKDLQKEIQEISQEKKDLNESDQTEVKEKSEKDFINLSDIEESFKISISKDKIPNLDEILKENHVITVNNLKISDEERKAFEEQKNRIRQILNKTKKTVVKKQTKKTAVSSSPKKSTLKKNTAKNMKEKEDIENTLYVEEDKIAQESEKSSEIVEIKDEQPLSSSENVANKPKVSDSVEEAKNLSSIEKAVEELKPVVIVESILKEENPNSSNNIESKIQTAIKTTNRIRCRRLSVVVDPIIHLSAFQQSNRKIRLTNNSQQNGFYDLLTNDQLFNAIKPQLKDEIQKSVKSTGKNSIKEAIEEVFASKSKAVTAASKTPAKTIPSKKKPKKVAKRRKYTFSRKPKKSKPSTKLAEKIDLEKPVEAEKKNKQIIKEKTPISTKKDQQHNVALERQQETQPIVVIEKASNEKVQSLKDELIASGKQAKDAKDEKTPAVTKKKQSKSKKTETIVPSMTNTSLILSPSENKIESLVEQKQTDKHEPEVLSIENTLNMRKGKKNNQKKKTDSVPNENKTNQVKIVEQSVVSSSEVNNLEKSTIEEKDTSLTMSNPQEIQDQSVKIEKNKITSKKKNTNSTKTKVLSKTKASKKVLKENKIEESIQEEKSLDSSLSSDTSNENDIPLSKLINSSNSQPLESTKDFDLIKDDISKKPMKANSKKQKSTPKKNIAVKANKITKTTKDQTINENMVLKENKDTKKSEKDSTNGVKVESFEKEILLSKSKKNQRESSVKSTSTSEKIDIFDINEDSFFNDDDNDVDQADEKINDLVNTIINSSELIDSESEKNEKAVQKEAKCLICKRSFKNEKVLEKHNKTSTHLFKEARRQRRIAELKEKEALKIKEDKGKNEKDEIVIKGNEKNPTNTTPDEIKIFRTKGALKTFDNILPSSNNQISEVKNVDLIEKDFKPLINACTIPDIKEFKPINIESEKSTIIPLVIPDDDENDDLSRKDKIFDSLFSNIENKLQAAAANAPMSPSLQKFTFPSLTPQESEVETSSTSWDLQHDADIEWDGDNNDHNTSIIANPMKDKNLKKEKINKSKETTINIPTKSLIMGKIFKKHRDREKQKTPQADAPNNKPGIKNSLDEIFDHLKNSAEIDDKVLTCPSPKTLLKSSGNTFSPQHSNDMLETASQSNNNNNNIYSSKSTQDKPSSTSSSSSSFALTQTNQQQQQQQQQQKKKKKEEINTKIKLNDTTTNDEDDDGIGVRKSRRRCAIKAKTFAETWSSDEYEELHDTNDIISIINEIEKRESNSKKRKSSKSESISFDNKIEESIENHIYNHNNHQQQQKSDSILKVNQITTEIEKKTAIITPINTEKKKSVQLQFPSIENYKTKSTNSHSIKKRRASTLKDGHKSDEETFTATKDLKPLKPSLSIMKKRRMSCFVSSRAFNDDSPPPLASAKSSKNSFKYNDSVNQKQHDMLNKKLSSASTSVSSDEKNIKTTGGNVNSQKKILSTVCNNFNSSSNNNPSSTVKKKIQKHRKRPRNKIKNIAYDSDSDFELNISKKSRNASSSINTTATFSDSVSEDDEKDEDEDEHEMVMPTSHGTLVKNIVSSTSSSNINSNTNELTMIKEPKLLPNDLNVAQLTTTANAAIPEDIIDPMQSAGNRTKRHSSEKLYYWSSSSSESELEHGDTADGENNEDSVIPQQPEQHGWIVGDSHKKLVTLLAHAKIKNKIN
ncbi:hypothetical protein PVAND_010593 [Polypedilum vanderplanki]|uniref:C2H2-type domain-containing protein n=1 Tax=Polypedilum vanderplanki TaxID=319348 RepID=A0A9J6CGQ9_POLVA|nr:hypothetical protein PVAND_010593 [Polypedilum vanderplanki]